MAPLRRLPPPLCAAPGTQAFLRGLRAATPFQAFLRAATPFQAFLRALLAIALRRAGPLPTTVSSLSAASSAGTLARDASHRAASS
jgi:hypothetical protein